MGEVVVDFVPWGRKTWCLKWCSSSCCKCDEEGLRWHGWRDEGLISPKKKPTSSCNKTRVPIYIYICGNRTRVLEALQGLWYQQEDKMWLSLKDKTRLPSHPDEHTCKGIWLLKHAGKKRQAPIVCLLFNLEISTIFYFYIVSRQYLKPTLPSRQHIDLELTPQHTTPWCFYTSNK